MAFQVIQSFVKFRIIFILVLLRGEHYLELGLIDGSLCDDIFLIFFDSQRAHHQPKVVVFQREYAQIDSFLSTCWIVYFKKVASIFCT